MLQVILDRQHPDLKSIRPVVDVAKAQATFINCTSEQCVGKCSDELLERFGIKDKVGMKSKAAARLRGGW